MDGGTTDGSGTGDTTPPPTVSFSADVLPIFKFCSTCHRTDGFADLRGIPLRLTDTEAYDQLINQPGVQDPSFIYVVPGDSASSLLFIKISTDTPPFGNRMPLFSPSLTDEEIALIRDWIDEGALNN